MPAQERDTYERVVFSKIVDYRRDVKHGLLSPEDQARIGPKIAEYNAKLIKQRKRKEQT